jgi:hypothetical protein
MVSMNTREATWAQAEGAVVGARCSDSNSNRYGQ